MDGKCVDGFDVRVTSELREDTRVDPRSDAVICSLNVVKHSGAAAEVAEACEHTLLRPSDSHHLRARETLSVSALLRVGSAVTTIAESLRINSGCRLIE